ncbi:SRC kinase signaling inhibitor 1 [Goodea atripinnis]|uniref:SRC kinase signaling inhibitor 1 n=1 Tax=Goodea atripinnis TaxID=208336 RepID=A0ABV0MPH0_9TELE
MCLLARLCTNTQINPSHVSLLANAGACYPKQDPERGGSHMISTDDLEYPREYRTLGNSGRRFSNVGLVHTSEHRHTVSAAQSLEALTNLHKADMERKRDAFMDHLKNTKVPMFSVISWCTIGSFLALSD